MAKRYYISRVLGVGTFENPYRSELNTYIRENWENEPHFIRQVIFPEVLMWCIGKYDLSDACHTEVMANLTGIFSFPQGALSTTMAHIPQAKRLEMRTKLENIGFSFDWATNTTTVRKILEYVYHSLQLAAWAEVPISAANFDLDTTVSQIPVLKRQNINIHLQDLGIDTSWITLATTVREVVQKIQFQDDQITPRLFGKRKLKQWFYYDEDSE